MPRPKPLPLALSDHERRVLRSWLRKQTASQALVLRPEAMRRAFVNALATTPADLAARGQTRHDVLQHRPHVGVPARPWLMKIRKLISARPELHAASRRLCP
ncbi:hypothetical protein [Streptomyces microflavus]|uniref:hypothetical protein n=1 Tax=Streptomyces microflavus TaxID=1919 RepID=UPI0033BB5C65